MDTSQLHKTRVFGQFYLFGIILEAKMLKNYLHRFLASEQTSWGRYKAAPCSQPRKDAPEDGLGADEGDFSDINISIPEEHW